MELESPAARGEVDRHDIGTPPVHKAYPTDLRLLQDEVNFIFVRYFSVRTTHLIFPLPVLKNKISRILGMFEKVVIKKPRLAGRVC